MIGNKALILGTSINSDSFDSLLKKIVDSASIHACVENVIFTPNPEFLVEAQHDPEFRDLLNKADINLPDGIGLVWAGRILGEPIFERVSGADMVERLLEYGNKLWVVGCGSGCEGGDEKTKKWSVGIAGARRGERSEAEELIKRLQKRYLNINFINLDNKSEARNPKYEITAGWRDPTQGGTNSNDQNSNDKNKNVSDFDIRISNFNVIFACQGMKKQEKWIWENKDKIKANVFMGVGGSLDFLTGFTYRAPVLFRSLGFEWVWRLIQKPSHIKRIWRAVFVFGWLVIKERLKKINLISN